MTRLSLRDRDAWEFGSSCRPTCTVTYSPLHSTNAFRMAAELDHYPEELVIDLPSGINLEADLWRPQVPTSDQEGNKFAICLHPWSWLGGRKEDP